MTPGRALALVYEACGAVAALVLGATCLLVAGEVASRNLGFGAHGWVLELSEYSLPLATFLAAPWLLRRGEHVRLDLLVQLLPRRPSLAVERLADVMGFAVSAVLFYVGLRVIADSMRQGAMVMKTLVFPEWWLYLPVPLCFGLLAIEFVRRFFLAGTRRAA